MAKQKNKGIRKMQLITTFKMGYRIVGNEVQDANGNSMKLYASDRYPGIQVMINGSAAFIPAHRLAAYQKSQDKMFKKGMLVRHLNDDKNDFRLENIEIGTHADNINDWLRNKATRALAAQTV
ncbi:hypothetical protein D3C75_577810 [compost metagenome]